MSLDPSSSFRSTPVVRRLWMAALSVVISLTTLGAVVGLFGSRAQDTTLARASGKPMGITGQVALRDRGRGLHHPPLVRRGMEPPARS